MAAIVSIRKNVTFLILLFCGAFPAVSFSQAVNLVENPSFEDYTYPPISTWPGETEPGKTLLPGWVTPTPGTADFFNSDLSLCDGRAIAKARSGQGRCAMILGLSFQVQKTKNYKEYIQGKFMVPLEAGKKYCVRFYVALDRACPYTTAGIGAYISRDPIRSFSKGPLSYAPQIISHELITSESGWTKISGTFIANGGEQYITLGSFSDTSVVTLSSLYKEPEQVLASGHITRAAYFYFDDVSVTLDDGKMCDCSAKADQVDGDYYLFLLDISGSMNRSGKLGQMKKQIKRFTKTLNENNRMGIVAFSDNAKLLLPFLPPSDSIRIDTTVDRLKSHGITNGDFAIRRVADMIDSMHLPQRTHVIIATDGIFNILEPTEMYVDSVLNKNNASFCVLQFGNTTNKDLLELTQKTQDGKYYYVTKRNVPKFLDTQIPPPAEDPSKVHYTDVGKAIGTQTLENILLDMTR